MRGWFWGVFPWLLGKGTIFHNEAGAKRAVSIRFPPTVDDLSVPIFISFVDGKKLEDIQRITHPGNTEHIELHSLATVDVSDDEFHVRNLGIG